MKKKKMISLIISIIILLGIGIFGMIHTKKENKEIFQNNPNIQNDANIQKDQNTESIQNDTNIQSEQNTPNNLNIQSNQITQNIQDTPSEKSTSSNMVSLTEEQKTKIKESLEENACTLIYLISPAYETKKDFQDFNTRIETIRNYLISKHMENKLEYQDNVIWKDTEESYLSSNAFIKIDYLKEYYKKMFLEELDENKLTKEKIWEGYYDTGVMPGGGCLGNRYGLNKIEYNQSSNTYTMYLFEVTSLLYENPEKYENVLQFDDTFMKENNLEGKLSTLKIEFRWQEEQVVLVSATKE